MGVDVPGLPPGWYGTEYAFSATSKSSGKTYITYSTSDGKHKGKGGVTEVFRLYCRDHGLDYEKEYGEYVKSQKQTPGSRARCAKAPNAVVASPQAPSGHGHRSEIRSL